MGMRLPTDFGSEKLYFIWRAFNDPDMMLYYLLWVRLKYTQGVWQQAH